MKAYHLFLRFFLPLFLLALLPSSCTLSSHDVVTVQANDSIVYQGEMRQGKYNGYGMLTSGDSILYSGQWVNGRRQGRGWTRDSLGRRIDGYWNADTLVWGERHDSTGVYRGEFDRLLRASGHGTFRDTLDRYYEGRWMNDKRSGFGFSLEGRYFRVGEWQKNIYRGERLHYTSERIYGIDLSKYQHIIKKKHYAIDWNRLRISHLGSLSKKNVSGTVDYKISFIFIKSTEGTTVRNPYFKRDYLAARQHGYPVGAYHFFSTRTPGVRQAAFFLRNSRFQKGDLPPVLDLEPRPSQIRKMGGTEAMWCQVRAWLRTVERQTGVRPVLYISQMFVNRYLPSAPDIKEKYSVWIARYGEYKPDVKLRIWQLAPDGRVAGIHGTVDINVFNGYQSEFDQFRKLEGVK